MIDLPHLAITTLSYYNFTLNPGSWNGWAGDLVSAYGLVRDYYKNNPGDNLQQIARAYVGGEFPKKICLMRQMRKRIPVIILTFVRMDMQLFYPKI